MKRCLIALTILLTSGFVFSQEKWETPPPPVETSPLPKMEEKIYVTVDESTQFPGGDIALQAFIKEHLVYPPTALENGITGTCYLRLTISSTGYASLERTLDYPTNCVECNQEAIRLIRIMPRWIPAKIGGKAVGSYYDLSITFELPK